MVPSPWTMPRTSTLVGIPTILAATTALIADDHQGPLAHRAGGPRRVPVDVHAGGRGHTHLDLRWLLHGGGAPRPPAGESQEVAWFEWPDAINRADRGLRGALVALQGCV